MDSVGLKRNGMSSLPAVGPPPGSVGLKTRRAEYGARPLDHLVFRGIDALEGVRKSELVPLVAAHLMERQDVYSFDVAEIGGEIRDLLDLLRNRRSAPAPGRSAPTCGPPADRQAAGKCESRADIHTGQAAMAVGIPRLDVEQDEVDVIEISIGEAFAVIAVRVQRGVHADRLRRREELDDKPVLHQRFATADGQTSRHDLQPVTILAQFLGRPRDRQPASRWSSSRRPGYGSRDTATYSRPSMPRLARPDHPRSRQSCKSEESPYRRWRAPDGHRLLERPSRD